MLKVGKLYSCEEYFLLLYPDQETAAAPQAEDAFGTVSGSVAFRTSWGAMGAVAFCSQRFGKYVSYTEKNIPILVLNSKEKFYEVLAGDRKGWIIYQDWLELKEIQ